MKILVTGFEPFLNEAINPSWEAVAAAQLTEGEVLKVQLPTSFEKAIETLKLHLESFQPDYVLSVGQAGGRAKITLEKVAINLMEAKVADNDGKQPINQVIEFDGADGYFTTLPIKTMIMKLNEANLPSTISYTAGTFVCNTVMYEALYLAQTMYPKMKCGFMHVPYIHEQVVDKGDLASMSLDKITKSVEIAVKYMVKSCEYSNHSMGKID